MADAVQRPVPLRGIFERIELLNKVFEGTFGTFCVGGR